MFLTSDLCDIREQYNDVNFCLHSFVLSKLSSSVSRPLSGLPLIPSLVVLAPKTLFLHFSLFEFGQHVLCWPPSPSAPHPLKPLFFPPDTSDGITRRKARRPRWQPLGILSKLFLSKTIKLVKMFHLLHKPLTSPPFFLLHVWFSLPPIRITTLCLCLHIGLMLF